MRRAALVAPLTIMLLGGCATTGGTPGDPYEKFNRATWSFNRGADKAIVRPAANAYRAVVPKPGRDGVSNFFANVQEPFSFINSFFQGKLIRAFTAATRFAINTTVGIGGLFDPASKVLGIKKVPEDLGQTFATWGVRKSPFLMIPLLGPSTVRDGVGTLAAQWVNPYNICLNRCDFSSFELQAGMTILSVLDTRAQVIEAGADTLLDTSADDYAVVRSAYLQRREAQIDDRDEDAADAADGGTMSGTGDDAALNAALKDIDQSNGTPAAPADGTAPPTPAAPTADMAAPPADGTAPSADAPPSPSPAPNAPPQ